MRPLKLPHRNQLHHPMSLIHIVHPLVGTYKLHQVADVEGAHIQTLGSEVAEVITLEDRSLIVSIRHAEAEESKPVDSMHILDEAIDSITR